ncbi:MAG TPA: ribose 5-phosphate isomerase B, partial [Candidatus Binatia bacterium]|nr:ribose 5-phosphate isomerase B [Candidatus Binatia bacterium]
SSAKDLSVVVASDHAAVAAKRIVTDTLAALGVACHDLGAHDDRSVDYPDYAAEVASAVSEGRATRGVLLCGTGIGMSIAANKFPGVRAALVHDVTTARMSRLHNDANVLVLGGGLLGDRLLRDIVEAWFATEFEGGRHQRRLDKIAAVERAAKAPR